MPRTPDEANSDHSQTWGVDGFNMTRPSDTTADLTAVVRSVLLVARLGEADRQGWWGTRSFGPAGRVVLKQRLPRTWRMAAAELDITAARNRHDEIIERRNAVHLFSDNWPVRRWTSAWIAEQKTANPSDAFFQTLEAISTDEIRERLRGPELNAAISGTAVRLGTIDTSAFGSAHGLAQFVALLAAAYAEMDGLTVPYLDVSE